MIYEGKIPPTPPTPKKETSVRRPKLYGPLGCGLMCRHTAYMDRTECINKGPDYCIFETEGHLSTTHNPGTTEHFTRLMTNLLMGKTYYVRGFCFHRKLGGFIVLLESFFFKPLCVTLHRTWPHEKATAEKKNTGNENGAQNRQSMDL
jgi:hypothetical protein